jgi:hypothetical protein
VPSSWKKTPRAGVFFFAFFCYNLFMKLSIAIMMHLKRKEYLPYLESKLGKCPVAMDEGCGLLQNCHNAWAMYDPTADYHVVIQDDCIVCDNFYNLATAYLEKANGLAVSFFYSQSKFYQKFERERKDTGAITKKALYGGLAICLPTKLIPEMLIAFDKDTVPFDDHRIGRFLMSKKINIYNPFPCLIDHRQGHKSLFTGMTSRAKSAEYIDEKK